MIDPLAVLCPVCLAGSGQRCTSIVMQYRGCTGEERYCKPHVSRVERAARHSFKLIEEDSLMSEPTKKDLEHGEPGQGVLTPPVANPLAAAAAPEPDAPTPTYQLPPTALQVALYGEADDLHQILSQLKDTEVMLGLRCPCRKAFMMVVDVESFATMPARQLAAQALGQFIPKFADHLELLAERIDRVERQRAATPGGKGVPTAAEVAARYHNEPCPLRRAVAKPATEAPAPVDPTPESPTVPA